MRRGRYLSLLAAATVAAATAFVAVSPSEAAVVDTPSTLVSKASGRCLTVEGGVVGNGTRAVVFDCGTGAHQQWTPTAASELRVFAGTDVKCLDVSGGGTTSGSKLITWGCHGGANQKFTLDADGHLKSTKSGLCLDVSGGGNSPNNTPVILWTCSATGAHQVWTQPVADPTPPTAPGNLTHSAVAGSSVNLAWTAATDNVGVTSYDVRGGTTVISSVPGTATTATVTGLACNTPYTLHVVARDAAQNTSPPSNSRSFTTLPCGGGVPSSIATVSTGWTIPWAQAWAPDGQSSLVTQRNNFQVYRANRAGTTRTLVGTVPESATTGGEGGLLGVAFSPTWNGTTDRDVFVMHTSNSTDATTGGNRIARLTYDGTTLSGYTAIVAGIRKNTFHDGGRIAFGPDGFLYATTGDAQDGALAQNLSSLNGKILRVTKTGAAAPGNPFGTRVYSYGHRNPQGLGWDSQGRLWSSEFGQNTADELNLIKPGRNYGWPTCEGVCTVAGMENPKRTWTPGVASPSGIAIVRDVVYMGALRGERLWRIPIGAGETVGTPTAYYVGLYGRLRALTKVPGEDAFWMGTTNCDQVGGQPAGSDKFFRVSIT